MDRVTSTLTSLSRLTGSSRARLTWRLLWIVGVLGALGLGVAAPGELDIP